MSADQDEPAEQVAADEAPQDQAKRKFREALEAKKGRQGQAHTADGQQSSAHAHGPVDSKRVFRRKTG